MGSMGKIENFNHTKGVATILAIGTANPTTIIKQTDYPDFYFRNTNSEHKIELKNKFERICEKTAIEKRHIHLTEDLLKANPNMCSYGTPSLNARQDMLIPEIPKLGKEASIKAIKEWGQPISTITHVVFATTSCVTMPGADFHVTNLLGLNPTVNRHMVYQQGCYAGGTALRLAKDLAENNAGSRVLVVCSEIMAMFFHGPNEERIDVMIGQALFGDGAAAMIVGADPIEGVETPLFRLAYAGQTIVPNSEFAVIGNLHEMGMSFNLSEEIPRLIGEKLEECLSRAVGEVDWNSLFYAVHPGGRAILDEVEQRLGLKEEKLYASRHVLKEHGNMASSTVLFILEHMRKKSLKEGKATTGEGLEWGLLLGFGPGLTVETILLQSVPLATKY